MEMLLPILAIPVILAVAAFLVFKTRITWKEFLLQMGSMVLLLLLIFIISRAAASADAEIWSGRVTGKERIQVPCKHCTTVCDDRDEDGNCTSSHEECDHDYDYEYHVYTSNGEDFEINTIDRQGLFTPPRWKTIRIGEATALPHSFTNYVKANKTSLFRPLDNIEEAEQQKLLPDYPSRIHDYYHCNRFVDVNVGVPGVAYWNEQLMELNADLGKKKKMNLVLVAVKGQDKYDYTSWLDYKWLRGKKNDLILVLGVNNYPKISWVSVISWTDLEKLKITLEREVQKQGDLSDPYSILGMIRALAESEPGFVRKKLEVDFKYLRAGIRPPGWVIILLYILAVGGSIALTIVFHQQDVFNDEFRQRFNYFNKRRFL